LLFKHNKYIIFFVFNTLILVGSYSVATFSRGTRISDSFNLSSQASFKPLIVSVVLFLNCLR